MLVLFFADAVKLQVDAMLARGFCCFAKLDVFGETNSVGGGEYAIKPDLLCVRDCVEIVRRESRLATGEENDDLATRFEGEDTITV